YVLSAEHVTSLPSHCYTLYSVGDIANGDILNALAPEALVVLFSSKQSLPQLQRKSVLEEHFMTEQAALERWLEKHDIILANLMSNIEKSNQALDTLLGSSNVQAEFLHK